MNENDINASIPDDAKKRLEEMKSGYHGKRFFTSDLTVNEFLLVKESGFSPAGLVVGSSIYHIGFQFAAWTASQEMQVLTQALYNARELAMSRMQEEAHILGADGIVGVRLTAKRTNWDSNLAEFIAIGTAVYNDNNEGNNWRVNGKPFTSDLSGQDFWTLLKSGYRPLGLVMGNCVYHIAIQSMGQLLKSFGQNVEMTNFTQGIYDARELAMSRMQTEAESLDAQGIVGVNIHEGSYGWDPHVIEFFAVGTAITPFKENHTIPEPQLILSLNN